MKSRIRGTLLSGACTALLSVSLLMAAEPDVAAQNHNGSRYRVTVTNLTPGQPFSPALIVTHTSEFRLFEAGTPASAGIAAIAEEGDSSVALSMNMGNPAIRDLLVAGDAPFFAGSSVSAEIDARWPHYALSIAGMLGSTNDAFYGLDSLPVTPMQVGGKVDVLIPAYDGGSEHNSESCATVPGPPCGSGGVRDPEGAEGLITVHSGIHGVGDLVPSVLDWRNPVARVTIERIQ